MERKDFLKSLGILGVSSLIPADRVFANQEPLTKVQAGECVLIPQETEGPYPLDLSKDNSKFRQDITEGKQGVPLNLTLTFVNVNDNCKPIANARIDIWHCDKDGVYSGYNQPGTNTVGQTFCRGIQMTDSNGQVQFKTIYPGWYNGRITHIHFQVFLNSVLSVTSQMAFPDSLNTEVYKTSLYSVRGQNTSVSNNKADMVFSSPSDGLQYQLLDMTTNSEIGGYNGTLTVAVSAPTTGIINLEPETGGQFKLNQNYPNPYTTGTTIPFTLKESAYVMLELFDTNGRKITTLMEEYLSVGNHECKVSKINLGEPLPTGNYIYQITTSNKLGVFKQSKVMTVLLGE